MRPSGRDSGDRYRHARVAGLALVMPFLMLACPLIGLFGGRWLDGKFGTEPWLELGGLGLGLIAGGQQVYEMYQRVKRDLDDSDR